MTVEVVVMNKLAVAVAADSASTVTFGDIEKVKTTNKLFSLSKSRPVGVMISGTGDFMGIPWETLIKIYREEKGDIGRPKLKDYAEDFLEFLETTKAIPEFEKELFFSDTIESNYFDILNQILDNIDYISSKGRNSVNITDIERIASKVIGAQASSWKSQDNCPHISSDFPEKLQDRYNEIILKSIKNVFEKMPLTTQSVNELKEIAITLFVKEELLDDTANLVFIGFGEEEIYPSCIDYEIHCALLDQLHYREGDYNVVGEKHESLIFAFGQSDVVETFIDGVHPDYKDISQDFVNKLVNEYPSAFLNRINKYLTKEQVSEIKKEIDELKRKKLTSFYEQLQAEWERHHANPVTMVVSVLSKDELASLAESLAFLTSLKKKVTTETESVGGPIDVAVISKGDGFIWVKRKHYFPADLNHQFFANYMRRDPIEKK